MSTRRPGGRDGLAPHPDATRRRGLPAIAVAVMLAMAGCTPWIGTAPAPDDASSLVRGGAIQDPPIAAPADAWPATVTYVHDGDTVYLSGSGRDERKTRLIGIDTPEIGDRAECYGDAATELTRAFLPEGTAVLAANDLDPIDRYDRELVYLWLEDGTFVNLAIVELGGAEAVMFPPNDRYWDVLRTAERAARDAELGMWGACR